jgi:hypothetical protein
MQITATVLSIVRVVHQFDFDTTQIAVVETILTGPMFCMCSVRPEVGDSVHDVKVSALLLS